MNTTITQPGLFTFDFVVNSLKRSFPVRIAYQKVDGRTAFPLTGRSVERFATINPDVMVADGATLKDVDRVLRHNNGDCNTILYWDLKVSALRSFRLYLLEDIFV